MQMIHTTPRRSKKRKPTAKQRELSDSWEKLLKKYATKTVAKPKQQLSDVYSLGKPACRETPKIPSLPFTGEPCLKKANPVYTGTAIKGIGTMHNSNSVPVFSNEEAIAIAKTCEDAALKTDARITNSEGASVSTGTGFFAYSNSHGFTGGYSSSRHGVSCSVIAESGGSMQRDYWYSTARAAEDLQSAVDIGTAAGERTVRRLNAKKIKTCQVPVLFEAPLASGLISTLISAISGGNLYRKSSFLLDSLGKQIASPLLNIYEDPFIKKGLASSPFDNEGVATKARQLVQDGVLQGYVLSSYSARKLGMKTTGNAGGNHNLMIRPGANDFAGLLKQMGTGLVVTELLGHGMNMVTGDYSRGAAGFWVENGMIVHPVEEITIASNMVDMLKMITAIGNDVLVQGSKQVGSILIERMTVAAD